MTKNQVQLGIPFGTACHQLRKSIMFELVKETKRDVCFRCGQRITQLKELSIEHKDPWRDSANPKELFYSWDNIAFSHLKCNCESHKVVNRKYTPEQALAIDRARKAEYMRRRYTTERRREKKIRTGH